MSNPTRYPFPVCEADQGGMTLIELMVALVIGLIVSLAVFASLNGFEGRKRTVTSTNDIDQSGNFAVYSLDKWIRSAGSGFTEGDGALYGCKLAAARNGAQILPRTGALPQPFHGVSTGTENLFKLIPLVIVPGGTTPSVSGQASDVIIVMAGTSGLGEVATQFTAVPTDTALALNSTKGFGGGDQILIGDVSSGPTAAGIPCMIEEVAAGFVGGASSVLPLAANRSNSSYYYAPTINSNNLTSYTDLPRDHAYNLGNVAKGNPPVFMVVGVGENNTLMAYDLLQNQNPVRDGAQVPLTVADGVFEMHALYGVDTSDDEKVDTWIPATGEYAPAKLTEGSAGALTAIKRIKAVRIALIMRTSLPEKDKVSNNGVSACLQAPDKVSYFCGSSNATSRTLSEEEQHYRYRVIDTTIPLRNAIMVSTNNPS